MREVMQLQSQFTAHNTPPMQRRRQLVEHEMPDELRNKIPLLNESSGIGDLAAEGSSGAGNNTGIPWLRIYSESRSPSAMKGWYLALLFSADGQRVYLSLNQGTTEYGNNNFTTKPPAVLRQKAEWARNLLESEGVLPPGWLQGISLQTPLSKRGKGYENGNVVAVEYPSDGLPSDEELTKDLVNGLAGLAALYRADDEDTGEEAVQDVNVWIFQANPKNFDLVEFLGDPSTQLGSIESWSVRRYDGQIKDGDTVLLWSAGKDAGIYGVGTIVGSSYDRPKQDWQPADWPDNDRAINYRLDTVLSNRHILRSDLLQDPVLKDLSVIRQPNGTNFRVTPEQWSALQPLLSEELEDDPITVDLDRLVEETHWSREQLADVIETFDRRQQIILAGPPGTGKTWVAKAIAHAVTGGRPDAVHLVQFHPSYSYEDFVEGLHLVESGAHVVFSAKPGKLIRVADLARRVAPRRVVLIIDEINRANIPSVFGELLYLLEYRNETIELLHREKFSLPENLLIIATMNTADRSVRSIDTALRRRFEIFDCPARPEVLNAYFDANHTEVVGLAEGLRKLNEQLESQLDRHHTIGHSFFMEPDFSYKDLERAWNRQIGPLLEEYFFDQPDIAGAFSWESFWPKGIQS